jgi:uncharacterized protein (DUF983 family)
MPSKYKQKTKPKQTQQGNGDFFKEVNRPKPTCSNCGRDSPFRDVSKYYQCYCGGVFQLIKE